MKTAVSQSAASADSSPEIIYDTIILGGGPAGSTAGLVLARAGKKTLILERLEFPCFKIGESFLPRMYMLFDELGLLERLKKLPHVPKFGVEFAVGNEQQTTRFSFRQSLIPGKSAVNIARGHFDSMLIDAARDAGAEVRHGATVKRIIRLSDGDVRILVQQDGQEKELRARYLIDASGQATILGRHFNTRRPLRDEHLQKIAYYAHFENVWRPDGIEGGYPFIAMCSEGWFWMIPLDEKKTSIGLVIDADKAKDVMASQNIPPDRMLQWGMRNCPVVWKRACDAVGSETNMITADFSYTCKPYSGPGFFMAGDAATFLDPIFSSGVCLGMMSGRESAQAILKLLNGGANAAALRRRYNRFIEGSTRPFYHLIRSYYKQPFRELFLNGQGPLKVHAAVLSVLAGHVFPRLSWSLRWRMWFFRLCMFIQKYIALCPRRPIFALTAGKTGANDPQAADMAGATIAK